MIEIVETDVFGRVLLLDGHIQLTELDEHAYHESLVQIPMLNIAEPSAALIIGGGDGGVAREILRHESIRRVDMIEIDQAVIDECRRHMPSLSAGAFDDSRLNLQIGDAFAHVQNLEGPYDLIVADSTDVYEDAEGGLSEQLFTPSFYSTLSALLRDDGIVVTQSDNPVFCPYTLDAVRSSFAQAFPVVGSYVGLVPSFGGYSAFCYGSRGRRLLESWGDWDSKGVPLRYLSSATYNLAFAGFGF
jgi:spermidine synthase